LKLRFDFEDSGRLRDHILWLNRMLTRHFPGVSRHWCGVDGRIKLGMDQAYCVGDLLG
jgi:hypothetical protein